MARLISEPKKLKLDVNKLDLDPEFVFQHQQIQYVLDECEKQQDSSLDPTDPSHYRSETDISISPEQAHQSFEHSLGNFKIGKNDLSSLESKPLEREEVIDQSKAKEKAFMQQDYRTNCNLMHVHKQFSNILYQVSDHSCHLCGTHEEKLHNKLIVIIGEKTYFIQDKTELVKITLEKTTDKSWFNHWLQSPAIRTINDKQGTTVFYVGSEVTDMSKLTPSQQFEIDSIGTKSRHLWVSPVYTEMKPKENMTDTQKI